MKKSELAQKIRGFNEACEKVKHAYFWTGDNGNQSSRSWREKQLSDALDFKYRGDTYKCRLGVRMSRKNTYVRVSVIKNGVKTTRTVFRKILKELEA